MKTTKINTEITALNKVIKETRAKLDENFMYHFEWGTGSDLYCLIYKRDYLQNIIIDIPKNEGCDVINWHIETITKELLTGRFVSTSSNKSQNDTYLLRKEQNAIILNFLKQL